MEGLIAASGVAMLLAGVVWMITSMFHPNNHDLDATRRPTWKPAIGGQALPICSASWGWWESTCALGKARVSSPWWDSFSPFSGPR